MSNISNGLPIWQCPCCEMHNFARDTQCQACLSPQVMQKQTATKNQKQPTIIHANTKQNPSSTSTANDDDIKTSPNFNQDVTLSLRGIPEYDSYPYNSSSDKFLFMASIKAPFFQNTSTRTPIDLVCVIDESGSMSGDRIKLVKKTILFIINNLQNEDRFGCIAYSSASRQMLPLARMDQNGRNIATKACETLDAHGNTNLCQGLIDGIHMLQSRPMHQSNAVSSIFLFTDGQANEGCVVYHDIVDAITEHNNINTPLNTRGIINTFGFGANHNAKLLEEIATYGDGMYTFIKNVDMISPTFAEALGGLISVVGQKLKVHVEALDDVGINECLSKGFTVNTIKEKKILEILIPDIQSEESRDLVFQLRLNRLNKPRRAHRIIQFSVEYMHLGKKKKDILAVVCRMDRIISDQIGERNMELDIHHNRLVAADAMKRANNMAEGNDLEGARSVIHSAQRVILSSPSSSSPFSVDLVKDLNKCKEGLVDNTSYANFGNQYMVMNSNSLGLQRAVSSVSSPVQSHYRSSSRILMITKSQDFSFSG